MALMDLTSDERRIVEECLRAAVNGPFFPMWEFHTLFGLPHQEASDIAHSRLGLDDTRDETQLAINNALNNLTGYPHKRYDIWGQYISASPAEVRRILKKWKGSTSESAPGKDFFMEAQ